MIILYRKESILKLLFIIFILSSTIYSSEKSYIKIAKTSSKETLLALNSKFERIGVPIKYNYSNSKYIIFSGPYDDYDSAVDGLKKIKSYFPSAFIVENKDADRIMKQKQKSDTMGKEDNNYFVTLGLSYNNATSNHIVRKGNVIAYIPNENFFGYALDLGYEFDNGVFTSLGFAQIINNDIIMSNIYLTLNYKFKTYFNLSPYMGLVVGNSYLTWNTPPITDITYFDDRSTSGFTGIQFGVSYPIYKQISLSLGYRLIVMDHMSRLEVKDDRSDIQHKRVDNILFGLQYNF